MTDKKRDELMRPISVSISPAMVAQLQARAHERSPENPNVSAYVRRLIFQDLEGLVLDRNRALWIYRELEKVEGFLANLRLFDSMPKGVVDQSIEHCRLVAGVRDTIWRLAAGEPRPAGSSSAQASDAEEALEDLAAVDLDQLARSVPSRAVAGTSGRKGPPSAKPSPPSKAPKSSPKRAPR